MGKVWLSPDLSQAEARVVAWKGPVPKLRDWFRQGIDVHTEVAKMIGRVVQEARITLPKNLFGGRHWNEFGKGTEEREVSKRTVHGNNYGLGVKKYAVTVGLPEKQAALLQEIYFQLFPEIKKNYHAGIQQEIRRTRTLWTPEPFRFRKVFYDILDDDLFRAAYGFYAQSTIGALLNEILYRVRTWKQKEMPAIVSPDNIRSMGMDVALQIHDSVMVRVEEDMVVETAAAMKEMGNIPIYIKPFFGEEVEPLIVPMDFKVGPTWGTLKDYKL